MDHEKIDRFAAHLTDLRRSPHTVRSYRRTLLLLVAYLLAGGLQLGEATHDDLLLFLRLHWAGSSDATLSQRVYTLKSFFRWAHATGHVPSNAALELRAPAVDEAIVLPPSADEVLAVRDTFPIGSMLRSMVSLMYGTCVRVGELRAIRVVDLQQGQWQLLVRGKGKRRRTVPVASGPAIVDLAAWLVTRGDVDSELLYPGRDADGMVARETIARRLRLAAVSLGFDPTRWHPHVLRHAAGTHMHERGMPLQDVQDLLGHADSNTTRRYTRTAAATRLRPIVDQAHPWSMASAEPLRLEPIRAWGSVARGCARRVVRAERERQRRGQRPAGQGEEVEVLTQGDREHVAPGQLAAGGDLAAKDAAHGQAPQVAIAPLTRPMPRMR